jgi:hypothetical protein
VGLLRCRFQLDNPSQSQDSQERKERQPKIIMFNLLFVTVLLHLLAIFCTDIISYPYTLRAILFSAIIALATWGIAHPPSDNALINYANGFFLSWYLIWSTNVFFIYDIRSLRRLQMRSVQGHDFCYWEPIHETWGLRRLMWVVDLSTNFRGLGWMSTNPGFSWPPAKYRWCSTTSYGLVKRLQKFAVDYLIFCWVRGLIRDSPNILLGTLDISHDVG